MRMKNIALVAVGLFMSEVVEAGCNHDNCLRAFIKRSSDVADFCSTIATAPLPTSVPTFIPTACTGDTAARVTSACKCLVSQPSASITTTPTSSSTTVVASSSSTVSQPSCTPSLSLVGASEYDFNPAGAPFSINISCDAQLDTKNVAAFANLVEVEGSTVTSQGISFTGEFVDNSVLLSIFALDVSGSPYIKSFQLLFGNINMPVLVLGPDGNPVEGAIITANATIYPGVGHVCTTDASGSCTLANLPPTTIGLVARTGDNSIAVDGLAATSGQVTLTLMPYVEPDADASFDISNGTTGWSGDGVTVNTTTPDTTTPSKMVKRDTQLVVATNRQYGVQVGSKSFPVHPFTKQAYIKYKFVTSEVPGGYFGTQYNDYYSVTIRANTGAYVTVTNSMNALGLGAFDASGATEWYTLTLPVPSNTKSVRYDIGVSNVADNLLDSEVIVEKVGDLQCENCGDCSTCPTDPMCQTSCTNPPLKSCSFYRNCAQAQLGCEPSEYPLAFGEKNCLKISGNVDHFSPAGQNWVWNTMHCLQLKMVPVLKPCTATCASFSSAAFASHTGCYLDNGICGLPCTDLVWLFGSVGTDLFTKESLIQAVQVGAGCLKQITTTLSGCGGTVAETIAATVIIALLAL